MSLVPSSKKFPCDRCSKTTRNKAGLTTHKRIAHSDYSNRRYCRDCGTRMGNNAKLLCYKCYLIDIRYPQERLENALQRQRTKSNLSERMG